MIQRAKLAEYFKSLAANSTSHTNVANLNVNNLNVTNTFGSLTNSLTGEESPTSSTSELLSPSSSKNEISSPTSTSSPTPPSPFISTPHQVRQPECQFPHTSGYSLLSSEPGPSSGISGPGLSVKTPPPSGPPPKRAKIDHFETRLMIQKLTKLQNQNSKFKKNLFNPIAEKKRKINFAKQINNFIKRK